MKYELEFLINEISKFTLVNKKGKFVQVSDKLINSISAQQGEYLKEIKNYKYLLQYYIE